MDALPKATGSSVSYRPASHIPGYGGYCPIKDTYGATFGTATNKYYQIVRQESLNSSRKPLKRTISEGSMALAELSSRPTTAKHDHWAQNLPYSLNHTAASRTHVLSFGKLAQQHREQYKDHTGLLPQVQTFTHRRHASAPPLSRAARMEKLMSSLKVSSHALALSYSNQARDLGPMSYRRCPSARDRAVRDLHFEKR